MGILGNAANDKKPLFRNWSKANPGKSDKVVYLKLSGSEEWIILEGENSTAFINAESKVGQAFWSQVEKFEGKACGLQIISARGKLGFDVEPSDTIGFWSWDGDKKCEFDTEVTNNKPSGLTDDLWERMSNELAQKVATTQEQTRAGFPSVENTVNPENGHTPKGTRRRENSGG